MAQKRLELVITGDARKAQKALGDLDKAAGRTETNTSKALSGIKGSIVDVGVAAAGMWAFNEWNEAEKVGKQTEAVLKSTGQAAGVTADEVGDLAESISKKTAIDDEAIQSGQNWLLTFKNVRNEAGKGNDIFNQTTETMVDLSVAMGSDAKTAANLLGKALNDPVKGVTALSKVGVTFTAQQKEQIKALAETGDLLGAQKIILAEVESQVEGSAAAQATAYDRAKVSAGNLAETVGGVLAPAVETAAGAAQSGAEWFQELDGWQQKLAVGAAAGAFTWLRWGDSIMSVAGSMKRGVGNGVAYVEMITEATRDRSAGVSRTRAAVDAMSDASGRGTKETTRLGTALSALGWAGAIAGAAAYAHSLTETTVNSRKALEATDEELRNVAEAVQVLGDEQAVYSKLADQDIKVLYAMRDALGANYDEHGALADAIAEKETSERRAAEQTQKYAGAVNELTGGLAAQEDAAVDLSGWLSGYIGKVDKSINVFEEAGEAVQGYYSELYAPFRASIDAEAKLDDITKSIFENGRELDINTEKGRANNEALLDYIETATMAATQTDNSAEAMAGYRERLIKTLTTLGFTKEEVTNLLGVMGLTPADIITKFTTNAADAKAKVDASQGPNGWGVPTSWSTDFFANLAGGGWDRIAGILTGQGGGSGSVLGQISGAPGAGQITPPTRNPDRGPRNLTVAPASMPGGAAGNLRTNAPAAGTTVVINVHGSVLTEGDLVDAVVAGVSRRQRSTGSVGFSIGFADVAGT